MIARLMTASRMKMTTWYDHTWATMPRAVPAAGGCSVLVTVIRKIDSPTDNAPLNQSMNYQLLVSLPMGPVRKRK